MSPKHHNEERPQSRRRQRHKKRLSNRLSAAVMFLLALGTGALAYQEIEAQSLLALSPALARRQLAHPLPKFATSSHYEAIAAKAMSLSPPDYKLAQAASIKVLKQEPTNIAAWNRLALIDIADDGQLSRAGISYLEKSYLLAPYGDLMLMTWRTDFASQIWPALPDRLQQKTLRQIPVIAEHGSSWEWRIRHCRENPNTQIAEMVCAYAPGVVRPKR